MTLDTEKNRLVELLEPLATKEWLTDSIKLDIETLADEANMSVSSFHSNFKAVTNTSPIQYIKEIRLQKARMFMVQDGLNAIDAAIKVGYESASQFSREFKRYFGRPPVDEAVRMRDFVGAPFLSEAVN